MTVRTSSNPISVVKSGAETFLDTLAFNISTKSGVAGMASLRGGGVVIPGKHGRSYSRGKKRDEGRVVLSMWALGVDEDGVEPATTALRYAQWRANMDKLLMLFDTEMTTLTLRELVSPGVYREAVCEVEAAIDPEVLGAAFGRFVVELIIVDTFWSSDADVEWSSTVGTGALNGGSPITLTEFAGSTAPMESLLILVDGAIQNPQITDVPSGHVLRLDATTLAAGRAWLVNTDTWASLEGPTSMAYTGTGGTSVTASTHAYGPRAPRLFGLTALPGGPQITLSGSGLNAATRFRIKGRKRFH